MSMQAAEDGSNRPLHDMVIDRLGQDIVSGKLSAGSTVSADDIAAGLGVSRSVIREAVRVLEAMHLLEVRRRVGITILGPAAWNPFEPKIIQWRLAGADRLHQLRSLSELRQAIEPLAARLAAERATPEQCGALTGAVIGMSATARAANAATYLAHDIEFHRILLAASGNEMLAGLADVVAEVLAGRTKHHLMPQVAEPEALRLHGVVASAVQAGDSVQAERAMRAIVTESADAIQAIGESIA
jgi:DNA-binding FadR family transcriptional regulator